MVYTKRNPSKKRVSSVITHLRAKRLKNPCYGPLTQESLRKAAEHNELGKLDFLRGTLHCNACGQFVSARATKDGSFAAFPWPHERGEIPRRRAPAKDNFRKQ